MNMLSCDLNRLSEVPLYEQLYSYIKKEIIEGRLLYGTKLPSKRKLAEFLQISQNTVETAYEQLTAEGYVEVIPRKGYYIQTFEDLEYTQTNQVPVEQINHKQGELLYHFHPSQIDTEHFPFEKWRKYMKSKIDESHQDLLLLGDSQGEYELRCEIAHYLYHARGVQCVPEQIIIGAGMEILLQQLVLLFDKNAIYGVEDPGYHLIHRILRNYPNEVHPLQIDEEGVKVNQIEDSNIDVVYVTPSHHFPNGTILSVNRRTRLLNWAQGAANRYIIEDDYDSEFRYSGKTIPSLQSMDAGDKVIYLGSFSKSLMPSIRISYMVLPAPLLQMHQQELSFYHSTVSRIDQHVLTQFMKEGDFEKHLNRMRKVYRRKLDKVIDLFKPHQQIKIIGERSGLHIVLIVKNGMDEQTLIQKANEDHIKIYGLSTYSIEKIDEHPPKIILGFAGIPESELEKAIHLLLNSWGL
ncbi:GntR family transcriptional regulator [Bacillus sp. Soil745]|uniref:MocR-like pyridoxine biosynthesis transcription factor PdxR n=1 Tax=Peribacillus frigoritolerans TaxID=450367 RepID=UPI00070CAF10|nr:PLP-dependent aminotransferase family protein [Peribacillus frigoritolerans]KRF51784.1 GntR family transcriptional regulator [Bacillus sp. Soil745]PAW27336.1 GntR family transcriptional regulator [Peribacillus simplex]MED3712254.1 PLP-dependent aminotransferase family protein [Peribacillus frigoritolerans]MED3890370.1 PLP-dependent aminotransferase family protein [Peribacillus frigoritolerans]TWD97887.1 GntR family transcriptional regulator [Peribacillus frigoritolerans]